MIYFPNFTIDNIFQLADIHIRNLKRHKEYREVFIKVYKKIEETPKNTLVILAGDIFHNKTDISPEAVQLASEFIKNIADLRPTLLFKGNHDANLNNLDRLDALSPIVYSLEHSNLIYLEKSGVYQVGNHDFILWEVGDEVDKYISPLSFDNGRKKIVLYHGTVENIMLDTEMKIHSGKVPISLFEGADLGILGDIHKQQFLNEEKTIAYASSLIMQNYGEHPTNHGYVFWDVNNLKGEFIPVENDYGYITILLKENKLYFKPEYIPKHPRVRIISENCTNIFINQYISELKQEIKPYDLITQKINKKSTNNKTYDNKIGNLRDINIQNNLLSHYYIETFGLDEYQAEQLNQLNLGINQQLQDTEISRNIIWKLVSLEFDNLFSYGEKNIIKFDNLENIVGLFAPNHTGKSSLLDILTFLAFDTTIRTTRTQDILNKRKDKFYGKMVFEIESKTYTIERIGNKVKRYKDKSQYEDIKVDVNFYCTHEDGTIENLNGEQRRETNRNIKTYLGTFEDFILTSFSAQNNYITFINKTQTEKKNILSQFLDLDVFDSLYEIANNESKEINALIKKYESDDLYTKLHNENDKLKELTKSKEELEGEINSVEEEKIKISDHIIKLSKQIIDVGINENKEELIEQQTKENQIYLDNKSLEKEIIGKLDELKDSKFVTNGKINNHHSNIEELYNKSLREENEITKLTHKKLIYENNLKSTQTQIDAIGQFDPNCDFCKNTPFIRDAWKLVSDLKSYEESIKNIEDKLKLYNLENIEIIKKTYDDFKTLKNQLVSIEDSIKSNNSKLENTQLRIRNSYNKSKSISEKIDLYNKNKLAVDNNFKLEKEIESYKLDLDKYTKSYKSYNEKLQNIIASKAVSEANIKQIKNNIVSFEDLSHKKVLYEYYLNTVSKNGLPYKLISNILPDLENEINNILAQIVDFKIAITTSNKDIDMMIYYDESTQWSLELSSGMEKFITSIAIRVALMNISSLPRPNFLIIDEGFSNLDKESINSLYSLFDYLKQTFKFILIVSHIDSMKDMAQTSINITQTNGLSKINHIY